MFHLLFVPFVADQNDSAPCDSTPDCEACLSYYDSEEEEEEELPPTILTGVTCSLGPGRTVPCELMDKEGLSVPVYRFGEDAEHA